MQGTRLFRKNDLILLLVAVLFALSLLAFTLIFSKTGDSVSVIIDGKETAIYPLDEDLSTVISSDGENTLVIKDGKAFIENADCPDKICVSTHSISKKGQTIVCLPHKLVIEIQ